tara:strand:- start:1469 stop:2299 length:831 start_codon:yes stop_codon:yes gene_type:complete
MIKFLNYLALTTSIAIAGIAAYFSVIGMATIFAGAYIGTIVMMTALEVGKLVTAAYLHLVWEKLNYLKYYLLLSVGVLMLITSLGIFGYLSKANIETTLVGDGNNLELSIIETRIKAEESKIERLQDRLSGLDLVITTGRPQDRNYINRVQREERLQIATDIDTSLDLISEYTEEKLPIQRKQLEQESKIGPIKYVAEVIYGEDESVKYLDNAVRWVIYALIFVFDPLAVLLLVSSTGLIARRVEEEKPKVVENRYVLQVPKDQIKKVSKKDLQKS